MVSTKQGNRRRGVKQNNSRRFKAGGSGVVGGGGVMMNGVGGGFSARASINAMFSANQIPDNPGYVDFNEPTVPPIQQLPGPAKNKSMKNDRYGRRGGNQKGGRNQPPKPWSGGNRIPGQTASLPPLPPPVNRSFRNIPMPRMGGRPLPPPPMGMRPPIPPPMPPPNAGRFGPRPLIPPPMVGVPMPPPLMPPRGPPMRGALIPPRPLIPRGAPIIPGPIRRNKNIQANRKNEGKNRRRGPARSAQKNKKTTAKKTLSEIVNQYPLDKPWVTDEIKEEHRKKEEIENKLKGNKDDKLFAEFKVQRDKFVNLYEAARLEYIGKHPEEDVEKIMTESDKAKAEKNANTNENINKNTNLNENDDKKQTSQITIDKNNSNNTKINNVVGVVNNDNNNKNDTTIITTATETSTSSTTTSSSKADNNNAINEKANTNKNLNDNNIKQKTVEKPKQQPVNNIKPRATRARGKNISK